MTRCAGPSSLPAFPIRVIVSLARIRPTVPGSTPCAVPWQGCDGLLKLGHVLNDRGSKYAVSGCDARDRAEVDAALKDVKRDKSYAKATHNTWAVLFSDGGPLKGDDGESGAGMVILRMLEREGLEDHRRCSRV